MISAKSLFWLVWGSLQGLKENCIFSILSIALNFYYDLWGVIDRSQDCGCLGTHRVLSAGEWKEWKRAWKSKGPFHALKLDVCQTDRESSKGFPNTYGKITSSSSPPKVDLVMIYIFQKKLRFRRVQWLILKLTASELGLELRSDSKVLWETHAAAPWRVAALCLGSSRDLASIKQDSCFSTLL